MAFINIDGLSVTKKGEIKKLIKKQKTKKNIDVMAVFEVKRNRDTGSNQVKGYRWNGNIGNRGSKFANRRGT